jgi:hypothetical protein
MYVCALGYGSGPSGLGAECACGSLRALADPLPRLRCIYTIGRDPGSSVRMCCEFGRRMMRPLGSATAQYSIASVQQSRGCVDWQQRRRVVTDSLDLVSRGSILTVCSHSTLRSGTCESPRLTCTVHTASF